MKIILIGGTNAGFIAAERIRRMDEKAEILLLEEEEITLDIGVNFSYCVKNQYTKRERLLEFQRIFQVDIRMRTKVEGINNDEKYISIINLHNGVRYRENYDKIIITEGTPNYSTEFTLPDSEKIVFLDSHDKESQIKEYLSEYHPKQVLVYGMGEETVLITDILNNIGCKVVLAGTHLELLDDEINYKFFQELRTMGVDVILRNPLREITVYRDMIAAHFYKMGIAVDLVMICCDENPFLKEQFAMTKDGFLIVNEQMESSLQDVYVVGETAKMAKSTLGKISYISLKNNIENQCRTAVDFIYGKKSRYSGSVTPMVIKCGEVYAARVGFLEKELKERNGYQIDYTAFLQDSGNDSRIFIKLIFEKYNGKILGVQALGRTDISAMCSLLAAAIRAESTIEDLAELELIDSPSSLPIQGPLSLAGVSALDIVNRFVRDAQWRDTREREQYLDVRTSEEKKTGKIQGAISIPLEELRERMGELDREKPVYVFSQYGGRGSIACRILAQNGYSCYNMSGGYELYKVFQKMDTK